MGVVRRLDMLTDEFVVVRAGGVHAAGDPTFDGAFTEAVMSDVPGAKLQLLTTPPVVGAALLAIELLGLDADSVHDAMAENAAKEAGRWAPSHSTG